MRALGIRNIDDGEMSLTLSAVEAFAHRLRGELLTPESPGYDRARTVWNAMVDHRPALIAQCAGTADVLGAVTLAAEHRLLISVRGGGHHIAGHAVCEGGLMIDLSPMKLIRVNPEARRARVGPGATLGDFDHETQAFGLATPVGINSTTGIAGLTLGGGFGWLTRKHGLTADNLRSADVVTADGCCLRADAERNSDLFWGIRGGGGNFGIVTSFEFDLHEFGPEALSGLIVFPAGQAEAVLRQYREFALEAPDELCVFAVLRKAPPLPFLAEEVHGQDVLLLALFYAGAVEVGMPFAATLRGFGTPVGEHVGPQPYTAWQTAFDPLLTPPARNYWKSLNLEAVSDGAIEVLIDAALRVPSPQCEVLVGHVGGAANRISPDATAWPHRGTNFIVNAHGRWDDADDDARAIAWARDLYDRLKPHAQTGGYVNFMTGEEQKRISAAYGDNYPRLAALKQRYDPENLFRLNHNIRPEGSV